MAALASSVVASIVRTLSCRTPLAWTTSGIWPRPTRFHSLDELLGFLASVLTEVLANSRCKNRFWEKLLFRGNLTELQDPLGGTDFSS
jgi:hypothetical protein